MQWLSKINAVIRYHYRVEPNELPLEKWAQLYAEWTYVQRKKESIAELVIKKSLSEVLAAAFGEKGT